MDLSYSALREGVAWINLSSRGRLRITGPDAARLLHAMASNHIEGLTPGHGCYTFFLDAQGRILADAIVLRLEDSFLLDTEPETRERVRLHLEKHIIADDVTVEDVTADTAAIGVEGPLARVTLPVLGALTPTRPWAHVAWGPHRVVNSSVTGAPGFALICARQDQAEVERLLESAGAVEAEPAAVRTVRLENARPRYGEDFDERRLPHETQLLHAVHFNKGCYLGQEIVERIHSRGGVRRFLTALTIEAQTPPPPGTKILTAGKEVGETASAAWSPALGKVVAFGYLRLGDFKAGDPLEAAGAQVELRPSTRA